MKHLISKRWTMLLLILMPLLISIACNTLTRGSATDDPPTPEAIQIEADVVFGPGTMIILDTKAGLADLSSYKATLTRVFDGTHDGQPSQWSITYTMLSTLEPAVRQLTTEKTGIFPDLDPVFMAEADGAAYERRGENACTAKVIDQENSTIERLDPSRLLNSVVGADEAGSETVNGVAANHYTFDERAIGQLGLAQSTGEMWVASEGGYIVRYLLTTEGNADYFGEGIEGTLSLDYELTDINQPLTIELPADCPAGMVDAPLLPDAADVTNMPSLLTYTTVTTLADAAAFYQEQIPGLGWEPLSEPTIGETTALMDFKQGDQIMTVIIIVGDADTQVQIVLSRAQE